MYTEESGINFGGKWAAFSQMYDYSYTRQHGTFGGYISVMDDSWATSIVNTASS